MNKDPEDTRRELVEELKQAEESVRRIRELRDAHEGAARQDLQERLEHCERVLLGLREYVHEVEELTLRLAVERDIDQL